MPVCRATKRDGSPCTVPVKGQQTLCWAHSPEHAAQRRRTASKGGKGRTNKAIKDLHDLLEDLTDQVIEGELETSRGAVANQLIGTRIRLFEYERRLRETEELEERIAVLESQQTRPPGRRGNTWGL